MRRAYGANRRERIGGSDSPGSSSGLRLETTRRHLAVGSLIVGIVQRYNRDAELFG